MSNDESVLYIAISILVGIITISILTDNMGNADNNDSGDYPPSFLPPRRPIHPHRHPAYPYPSHHHHPHHPHDPHRHHHHHHHHGHHHDPNKPPQPHHRHHHHHGHHHHHHHHHKHLLGPGGTQQLLHI